VKRGSPDLPNFRRVVGNQTQEGPANLRRPPIQLVLDCRFSAFSSPLSFYPLMGVKVAVTT
jgi:hypothetical protein